MLYYHLNFTELNMINTQRTQSLSLRQDTPKIFLRRYKFDPYYLLGQSVKTWLNIAETRPQ